MNGEAGRLAPRAIFAVGAMLAGAIVLAGCTSTSQFTSTRTYSPQSVPPEQLETVNTGTVEEGELPPVGQQGVPSTVPSGQEGGLYDPGYDANNPAAGDPNLAGPGPGSSIITLGGVGDTNAGVPTGALTESLLIGGWTAQVEDLTCRVNFAQTAKGETGRYRASAPACGIAAISGIASWQLAGSQVQLFDEPGGQIATLLLSGGRFIGLLPGGVSISMFR